MLSNTPNQSPTIIPLCPCGKARRSDLERIPRGFVHKTFFSWLPLRRYKCYKCRRKRLLFETN